MKTIPAIVVLLSICSNIFAQSPSQNINALIKVETDLADLAKSKGIKKAFLAASTDNTIVFRPGPVSAVGYFKDDNNSKGSLWWQPMYAKISKSGDWGYTSGPYTFSNGNDETTSAYGQYFSVWKKENGKWKLDLDIAITHKKPTSKPELMLDYPYNEDYVRLKKKSSFEQREDIIYSTDKLYSTILKANGNAARKEFLADNSRLLFPGYEPIVGKTQVTRFWDSQKTKIISQPLKTDRAVSGEVAYTYGNASLETNGKQKQYYYLRIWEMQANFKWALLVEVLTPGTT